MSCRALPDGTASLGAKYAVAADGTIVFSGEMDIGLGGMAPVTVSRPDGSFVTADPSSLDFDPAVTARRTKIAFARYASSDPHAGSNIYTVNPDGSDLTLVAAGGRLVSLRPAFSPTEHDRLLLLQYANSGVASHCGPLADGSYKRGGVMLMGAGGGNKHMIRVGTDGDFRGGSVVGVLLMVPGRPDDRGPAARSNAPVCRGCRRHQRAGVPLPHEWLRSLQPRLPSLAITHETDDFGADVPAVHGRRKPDPVSEALRRQWNRGELLLPHQHDRLQPARGLPHSGSRHSGTRRAGAGEIVVPALDRGRARASVNAMRIRVPALHGLTLAAATKRLVSAHLTVGTVTRQYSSLPAGRVVKQSPLAGSQVKRTKFKGPKVNLVLSRGPQIVAHCRPEPSLPLGSSARRKRVTVAARNRSAS